MEDPKVVDQVEKNKEKVIIDPNSDNYLRLTAGNGQISGLDPNKYYMIETEKDENGNLIAGYPKYVTDNQALGQGVLIGDLGLITRISRGNINGLINFHTYKVREASPFPNSTSFNYSDSAGASNKIASVNNGAISLPAPAGIITLEQLNTQYNGYDIMAVAVNPATLLPASPFYSPIKKTINASTTSFKLEGKATTVDYVFYKADNPNPAVFRVLRIVIAQPGIVRFDLTFNGEKTTGNSATIFIDPDNGLTTGSLTVTVSGGIYNSIKWYHNGVPLTGTALTLPLNNDAANPYLVVGTHIFTVIVDIGGVPYSAVFTLTVKE
jgi:hypothetical protein